MSLSHRVLPALLLLVAFSLLVRAEAPGLSPLDRATLVELQSFGAAYSYDTKYLEMLLTDSPGAYRAFEPAQGMGEYRKRLPLDAHFVARVATVQVEDCGPCTQLNLQLAIEAGVERATLDTLLHKPDALPEPLRDIRDHARAVVGEGDLDAARVERLRQHYGDEGFAELAVVITGSRLYPTIKRALLQNESCILGDLKY